jgi:Zn-dependent membrane protease YugP
MAIVGILLVLLLLGAIFGPQFWIKHAMKKHGVHRPDFPGTGGELARHLLDSFGMGHVGVEITEKGDRYDPDSQTVRLIADHHDGASVTAVAVATHEVGHAIQHHRGETLLKLRGTLVRFAMVTDRFATIFFYAAPLLAVFARTPAAFFGLVAMGIGLLGVRVIVHLVTLPVELDASFGKALPILTEGNYISEADLPAARSVLKAAAFTYVAGALMSLVNLAQWLRVLR